LLIEAQEDNWESLLKQEVAVINPVYKPVIGLGAGIFSFYGNVKNNSSSPILGNTGYRVNVHTYIDNKRLLKANFSMLYGKITANQTSYTDMSNNLNFQSDLIIFGVSVQYDFGNIISKESPIKPYIALGLEFIQFNSKTDLYDKNGVAYHYWPDGTIRSTAVNSPNANYADTLKRSYNYTTPLSSLSNVKYNPYTLGIPLDVGLNFAVSYRVSVRLGYTYHYTFTNKMDYALVEGNGTKPVNDKFSYTYLSLHFDLFSDPKTRIVEKLFADVDFDYAMYGDEDGDGVFDGWDECPHTPKGIPVDSTGCPFDDDKDGVPNYRDKELNTPPGAIVDQDGVQIKDEDVEAFLSNNGVKREDVEMYLRLYSDLSKNTYRRKGNVPIPEKFKKLDLDKDNYISFDEVLKAINDFFDFESTFTYQDMMELTDFFFTQ
jgi:hypothetical protein